MAQVTNTYETFGARGIREELSNTIHNTDPEETPFMSLAGRKSIDSVTPEWQTDAYRAIDLNNNQPEGNEYNFDSRAATTRVKNSAQISYIPFIISGTLDEIKKAGRESEVAYQAVKAGVELRRAMEAILLSNQAASYGTAGGATNRTSAGLRAWIATNDNMNSGTSGGWNGTLVAAAVNGTQRAFSKTLLDDVVLNTYNSGGNVGKSTLVSSPYVKQIFSQIMDDANTAIPRTVFDKQKNTIIASAEAYKSDFGTFMVVPDRQMAIAGATVARNAFLVDPEMVEVGMFRDIEIQKVAKTGDAEKRVLLAEYTLIVKNEKAHGCVADLFGLTAST
jgi:predicted RNA-binding protein with TRAM domain